MATSAEVLKAADDIAKAGRREPFTRELIERRLRMPLLNVCLAAVGGKEDDLRDANAFLFACIETMISEATRGAM